VSTCCWQQSPARENDLDGVMGDENYVAESSVHADDLDGVRICFEPALKLE